MIATRKKFKWEVKMQASDGETVTYPISSYWSPDKEGCPEAIAAAAKGEAFWIAKKTKTFAPLSVTRLAD
jgi:hypothetical protein